MSTLRSVTNQQEWDALVLGHRGHPLQLWGWGESKALHGPWQPCRLWSDDCDTGAQVLLRKLPVPFKTLAYIPRGPFGFSSLEQLPLESIQYDTEFTAVQLKFLSDLLDWARSKGCIEAKIEPHWLAGVAPPRGFRPSPNDILVAHTVILDLARSEEELLATANKKTRQYVRKSAKDGVTVRELDAELEVSKIADCLAIYQQTAERAGFGIHINEYYYDIAKQLGRHNRIFIAEYEGVVVAFLWLAVTPALAFELYGGVTDQGQQVRANYTLKWQTICQMQSEGIALYDMNGLLNDGISNFKLGFSGGREVLLAGTLDAPLSPLATVWEGLLPKAKGALKLLRSIADVTL